MLLLIKKSFPWYRDAYRQGDKREVEDKTARQFIAAGLAAPTKADPPKTKPTAAVVRQTAPAADAAASAAEPKPAGEAEKPATDAENKEDKDKAGVKAKPGLTAPYKRRDLTPAK